jgi:hypothetical protein
MRSFVEKWGATNRELDCEETLNRLSKEFQYMRIPVTAVNGTILLSVYELIGQRAPVNRAVLVERFLEHLLEKSKVEQEALRGHFDFNNKMYVLACLAEYMAKQNAYILDYDVILAETTRCLDDIGLSQPPKQLLDNFIRVRVLSQRIDNQISFRYRAFLEFLIAWRMQESKPFRVEVLSEVNYLRFINEIQYYSGLNRTDLEPLEIVSAKYGALLEEVQKETNWSPDLQRLDQLILPTADSDLDLFEDFEKQMASPPLTAAERDEVLEGELPRDAEDRQEVFRPKMEELGHRFIGCLFLYSGLLKNLEMIRDDAKRTHLERVLHGWGLFTAHSLSLVPSLARTRKMILDGVQYEVSLPHSLKEAEVARLIYTDMPNAISRVVMSLLGTEKLERQLKEPRLDEAQETSIVQFYRHCLIADLRLSGWSGLLEKFVFRMRNSSYVLEILLRKTVDIYSFGALPVSFYATLRSIAGGIVADLRGGSAKKRNRAKDTAIRSMERQANLRRLKMGRE